MKTVLVIDDQIDNLITIKAVLKNHMKNCEVITALSGKEGIKKAKEEQPDTILLDIIMPFMDGYDTCKYLKADSVTKHIPIIMLTAIKTDSESRVRGLNIGADAFLSKPIDPTELTAQINVMLRIKMAEDKLKAEKKALDNCVRERTDQLRKSEEGYRVLIENQIDLIVKSDIQGCILYVSPSYCNTFGKTEDDLLNNKYIHLVHNDDKDATRKAMLELKKIPHKCYIENRSKTIDGWKWIGWTYTAILNPKSEVVEVLGVGRDIDDRKKAEEKLIESEEKNRQIVENSPYCIHQMDLTGSITSMNRAGLEMIGIIYEEEVKGIHYLDFVGEDDKARIKRLLKQAYKGQKSLFEFRASNDQIYASSFIPIIKNGKVTHLTGLTQDVTISRLEALKQSAELRLSNYSLNHSVQEYLQKLLDEVELLTQSSIGFYHFVSDNQESISLQAWSSNTIAKRSTLEYDHSYKSISSAGVWADCVRKRKIVVHNDYENLKNKKGLPDGHIPIIRELLVPIIRGKKIMSIIGIANKKSDYTKNDIEIVQSLADTAWETIAAMLAKEELKESEERFRRAVSLAPSPMMIHDEENNVLQLSDGWTKYSGYTIEDIPTLGDWTEKAYGKRSVFAKDYIEKLFKIKETINNGERRLRSKDGKMLVWDFFTTPLGEFADGKKLLLSNAVDITENRKAEEIIKESEERLKIIFEYAPDAIYLNDIKGNFIDINITAEKILGYNKKELIGKSFLNLNILSFKDIPIAIKKLSENILGRKTGPDEYLLRRKDGTKVLVEISAFPVKIKGKTIILGIARDISDRKKQEELLVKLSTAVEQSPSIIVITDIDGNIEYINPKFSSITGYSKKESIGKSVSMLKSGKQPNELYKQLWQTITSGKEWHGELRNTKKNGDEFWEAASISQITDKRGNITNFIKVAEDISERKRVEKSLLESEEKFKDTVNLLPQIVFEINKEGILTFINNQAIETTGYSKEELTNNFNVFNIILPEQQQRARESIYSKMLSNKQGNPEFTLIKKDGTTFPALLFSSAIHKDGIAIGVRGIVIDVTEQKKAEDKIRESDNRLRLLMQQAPYVVEVYNIDGLQVSVNKAYERLWGFPAQTTVNKFNILKSKEAETTGLIAYVKRAYAGESVAVPEYKFDPTGGTEAKGLGRTRWLSTRIYPLKDNHDNVKNIVIIHQDISEHKSAELIQKVIYNISNAVVTTDNLKKLIGTIQQELGTIIDTSNFYVALYNKKSDSFSFPFYADEKDVYTEAPANNTLTKYVIKTKTPLLANLELKRKFVKERKLKHQGSLSKIWLGIPLIINDKAIGAFAVQSYKDENAYNESDMKMLEFVSDQISLSIHRKIAEEDLKAALLKAEESDRLKSAFLANMSHEIRTPMNGILGFANLLSTPNITGEEIYKYTTIIERSGQRMLNIINNLIDISKIEAGQMKISLSHCNINEQLEYLYTFFKPEATSKNLQFSFDAPLNFNDAFVETDREKIYAILTNLIKNSIKYTHNGYIKFGYVQKENMLEFYVKDTGIGIPKDRQEAIFDRFVQADIEDSEVYEGAGLGLSIISAYIDMLGGEIWVDSEENTGSQFYFTIPFSTNESVKKVDFTDSQSENMTQIKDIKILIVEDESVADDLLTIILGKISNNILHAKNGVESIDIMQSNPDIDLILMDIKMPVMDGYTATLKIREFNKDVIIIAQTAFALSGDCEKAIAAGANDYIPKPINRKNLISMINKLL